MPFLHMTIPQNGILVHLKWYLFLFNLNFLSWISASLVPDEYIGRPFNMSAIFLWSMSHAGATPKGSQVSLYLLNGHANVVKYQESYHIPGCDTLNGYHK